MMDSLFIDVSRYNGKWFDPQAAKRLGIIGVYIRVTVGDYYTDPAWPEYYQVAVDNGYLVSGYHVMAPNDGVKRRITAASQMHRFYDAVGARKLTLPAVLDNELSRGEDKRYITSVMMSCFSLLHDYQGFDYPLNYSNANFMNNYVNWTDSLLKYKLFVANYTTRPTPYMPNGYKEWVLWQHSADENGLGRKYGFDCHSIDLSRVNPTWLASLQQTSPPASKPLTLEERVKNLEDRVAVLERR